MVVNIIITIIIVECCHKMENSENCFIVKLILYMNLVERYPESEAFRFCFVFISNSVALSIEFHKTVC